MPITRKFPVIDKVAPGETEPPLRFVPWDAVEALKIQNRVVNEFDRRGQSLDQIAMTGGLELLELFLHARRAGHHDDWAQHPTPDQMRHLLREVM